MQNTLHSTWYELEYNQRLIVNYIFEESYNVHVFVFFLLETTRCAYFLQLTLQLHAQCIFYINLHMTKCNVYFWVVFFSLPDQTILFWINKWYKHLSFGCLKVCYIVKKQVLSNWFIYKWKQTVQILNHS